MRFTSKYFGLLVLVLLATVSRAQDSLPQAWKTESRKVAEGQYELIFKTPAQPKLFVFAPNQELFETPAATIAFPDSSLAVTPPFVVADKSVERKTLALFESTPVDIHPGAVEWTIPLKINGTVPAEIGGELTYYYGSTTDETAFNTGVYTFRVALEGGKATGGDIKVASLDILRPVNDCGDDLVQDNSAWTIFLFGFIGGLIALLTPCVYPMIPVTVTFFTKKSQGRAKAIRNGVLYGLFIFLIYVLITVPFHVADIRPEIFNNISTNPWINLVFFGIFVAFALSFFGLYEIGLPSGLANKMDAKSGLGNVGGIFFMAATLTIVSFSCTGPILGTLLVGVSSGGAWPLTAGAAGFGIALGLPFALFAMFPHWLQSLPKSGGWMTEVKVVLGFVELALAVKFFSNADLVQQWGLLKREVFVAIWAIIAICVVIYLIRKWPLKRNLSPAKLAKWKFPLVRLTFIILFGISAVYLVLGLTTERWAGLKVISGFPPPRSYSLFPAHATHGVFEPIKNEYEKALELSREENKPVLIDFTGWACVNCREMEDKVWPDKWVDSLLRNEFIVVSLYVDEKRNLPLTEQREVTLSNGSKKSIVSVGDKWSTFQSENFLASSQPQYAIIDADQRALTKTKFYTANADEFAEWLVCGLEAFRAKK